MFPSGMPGLAPPLVPSPYPSGAPITLEDPLFPSRNAAATCFSFPNIAAEFESALLALAAFRPTPTQPTPLSAIIHRSGYRL